MKQKTTENTTTNQIGLLAALSKLKMIMPPDYDWKQDYLKAIEEKYENYIFKQ